MPELPEVETVVRGLKYLEGRVLKEIKIFDDRVWFESELKPAEFARSSLREVSRRGKYIILRFSNAFTLVQHLRMTGKMLELASPAIPEEVKNSLGKKGKGLQIRCAFQFEGTDLVFFDTRRFGTITSIKSEDKYFAKKKIAQDPFEEPEASLALFIEKIKHTDRPVKAALLDQSLMAGVGNIYADEALFLSGIHPLTKAKRVKDPARLWKNAVEIMAKSMREGGTSIIDYVNVNGESGRYGQNLLVYGRDGDSCVRCGSGIKKIIVGGRSTHFCPKCQKRT